MIIQFLLNICLPVLIGIITVVNNLTNGLVSFDHVLTGYELTRGIANFVLPSGYFSALFTCVSIWYTIHITVGIIRFIVSWIPFLGIGD